MGRPRAPRQRGSGHPQPRTRGGAPSLLPGALTLGDHGLAHPERSFLHRGLHHRLLPLLLGRQVSRMVRRIPRGCLFLVVLSPAWGRRGLRGPPGQEGRRDCFLTLPNPGNQGSPGGPGLSILAPGLLLQPLGSSSPNWLSISSFLTHRTVPLEPPGWKILSLHTVFT